MASEANIAIKTIRVSHLNGTSVGYHLAKPLVGSKVTVILIPPFGTSAVVFRPQVTNPELLASVNLLVLEPLGQGVTKTNTPVWTAWDSAYAFIQAMDALGVKKAFVLGESQGGWIAARMALYAPERITGIIPICTQMDGNTQRLLDLGCADVAAAMKPILTELTAKPNPDFVLPESVSAGTYGSALGPDATESEKQKLTEVINATAKSYAGDAGRLRLRQAALALLTRDSLLERLEEIRSPVLWIAGSKDPAIPEKAAREDSSLFKSEVQFEIVEGAYHWPTWTHAEIVNKLLIDFVRKYGGLKDARALREAVGMVDI